MVVGELAHERDVIIIGGGPGGYNAAIRAAQLGLSVTLVEKDQLGGVCLNQGCIPSKVFAHAGQKMAETKHLEEIGIALGTAHFNLEQLQNYKGKIVVQLRQGVEALCKANKIEIVKGTASFIADDRIGVEADHAFDVYRFKHAIIATGASPVAPENIKIDHERILNAQSIYNLEKLPSHLILYGSDYITLETAMCFSAFGSAVSIVLEDDEDFSFDASINRELHRILKKAKIKVYKKHRLVAAESGIDQVTATFESNGSKVQLEGSHLFVTCKVKAATDGLGLERLGLQLTNDGFIEVDNQARTSLANVYAVGDVTGGQPLAIKAIQQGKVAAEAIAGEKSEIDLTFMPTIVHTTPPIAAVGLTEEEAKQQYGEIHVGQFSLTGNGYAAILGQKDGFVKVITDTNTDLVLGIHMMGAGAVELITSGIIGLEMVARDEDIKFPLYPHPSINEGLLEAVEALKAQAIHLPPNKQQERAVTKS